MNEIMTPTWFPWILIGGLLFTALGFIGSKYKDKPYRSVQSIQDFISGSILVAFTGVLMPDLFPPMEFSPSLPSLGGLGSMGGLGGLGGLGGATDDFDLQVGPPRLIRG